jgi:hypothetical protein
MVNHPNRGKAATDREALERAARLIAWMAGYIGKMAPMSYGNCYSDLNEHFLYCERNGVPSEDPSNAPKPKRGRAPDALRQRAVPH